MKSIKAIESPLVKIVQESGLETTKAQFLLDNFSEFFKLASEWEKKAKSIKVTSADQKFEMKIAREGRLLLREKRISIEKARVNLGSQALREKQTIDSIARILKNLLEPIEQYLDDQEHFIEIEAQKAKEERTRNRIDIVSKYEFDATSQNVADMSDEDFQKYIDQLEAKKQAQIAEQKRLEQERIDAEKKRQKELKDAQEEAKRQQKLREQLSKRAQKLTEIGFGYNGAVFKYDEIFIEGSDVMKMEESEFKELLKKYTPIIKDREAVKEKTRKQAEESTRKAREAEEARVKKIQDDARATQKRLDDIQKAQSEIKVTIDDQGYYIVTYKDAKGIGDSLLNAVNGFCKDWTQRHSF